MSRMKMKVLVLSVLSVSLASARPQLDIPGRIFSNFPSRSNSNQVQGELSSVSVVTDDVSNTAGGLLNVLNSRSSSLPATSRSRTTVRTASSGEDGPPMPYSFDFNIADEESQVYHARQEESDGETVVGSYSYVDPTGALIIVNYRAGVMGYTETRERQDNYLQIRPVSSKSSSTSSTTSTSTSSSSSSSGRGSGSNRFASSSSGGTQQLTTTLKKKKTVDQNALIAKIIAALQPQLSSIVDESIDEFETVTEEKIVTVEKLPTITSTFEFSEQQQSQF